MCLGADVELSLIPQSGFHTPSQQAHVGHDGTLLQVHVQTSPTIEDTFEPCDPLDKDDYVCIGAGLLREAHETVYRPMPAVSPIEQTALSLNGAPGKDEVLFLTMVHGDMVLLEGDDFNVSSGLVDTVMPGLTGVHEVVDASYRHEHGYAIVSFRSKHLWLTLLHLSAHRHVMFHIVTYTLFVHPYRYPSVLLSLCFHCFQRT